MKNCNGYGHAGCGVCDVCAPRKSSMDLKIGDRVPMPERKLDIRPTFTGPGKTSFKPARKDKR